MELRICEVIADGYCRWLLPMVIADFRLHNSVVDTLPVYVLSSAHGIGTYVHYSERQPTMGVNFAAALENSGFETQGRRNHHQRHGAEAEDQRRATATLSPATARRRACSQDQLADILELSSAGRLQLYDLAGQTRDRGGGPANPSTAILTSGRAVQGAGLRSWSSGWRSSGSATSIGGRTMVPLIAVHPFLPWASRNWSIWPRSR